MAGAESAHPSRQGPRRPKRARAPGQRTRTDRSDRVRRARQPARNRVAELWRKPNAEPPGTAAMMDDASVSAAVDELGRMLRADGADLLLIEADPKTARVHLRLMLDAVRCEACVP